MNEISTLYVRVVPQDRDRDYLLLGSFEPIVIQRTAVQYITLNAPTRAGFDHAVGILRNNYSAKDIKDTTASGIAKKLQKIWGEDPTGVLIAT